MKTLRILGNLSVAACALFLAAPMGKAQTVPGTFTEWDAIATRDASGNPTPVRDFDTHITDLDRTGATGFSPDTPWYTIDNRTPGPPCALGHLEPSTNVLTSWGYGSGVPVGIDVDDSTGRVWFTVSGGFTNVNSRVGFKFPNGSTACGMPSDNCFRHFPNTGNAAGVTTDAMGNAYVAEIASAQNSFRGTILRITPSGTYTRWTLPTGQQPRYLAFDSSGDNLYFTVVDAATINRLHITTNTLTTWSFPPPAAGSSGILDTAGIFLRNDDEIWYADTINDKVSRLKPSTHTITEFTKPGIDGPSFIVFSPLILRVQALVSDRFGNTIDVLEEDPSLMPPDFPDGVDTVVTPTEAMLIPTTVDVTPVDFQRTPLSREITPVVTDVDGVDPPGITRFPFPSSGSQPIGITESIVTELSDGTLKVGIFGDEFGRDRVFLFESPLLIPPPGTFIDLSPDTDVNNEGQPHTVTALVTEGLTNPVPVAGVEVTLEVVSGPNAGLTRMAITDANGEASFTYIGTDVGPDGGTDRIRGSFVDDQGTLQFDEVEKIWLDRARTAGSLHAEPASLLVYPHYSSRESENTLITVTNVSENEVVCGNGFRKGDVQLHFEYFSETWQRSDSEEYLTPTDTVTVLARGHNPNEERGFLVVEARDPETNRPIDFDRLLGSAIIINAEFDFQWSYTPYIFNGLPAGPKPNLGQSACGHPFIDPPDGPDAQFQDFNGIEYSLFPDVLLLDQFFGEGIPDEGSVLFGNQLFLMSTDPGGTNVALVGYNNNERSFSRTFSFDCYLVTSLVGLTQAMTQQNLARAGDSSELGGVASGWLKLRTTNPEGHGILGVIRQQATIGGDVFTSGRELQFDGVRSVRLPRTP